jgi:mono/diheme cytochrome c family protein
MRMTFRLIVVGGLIVFFAVVLVAVFLPTLLWKPPQTIIAHPYTAEQERGRQLFYSNGCNYCHTQYVRDEDTAMGPVSQGGNYDLDNPMILGSERTGPDLSYLGRKRSEEWEIEHLKNPRELSPLSIMPNFYFLPDDDLKAIAEYLFALGDRVAQARMILPPEEYAAAQDPLSYPPTALATDGSDQGWATWTAAGLQEGKELYVQFCLTCHGCAGNGLGTYGGTMSVTPADFKQEPFRSMPDEQWFWHVSEGLPGTLMPVWKASLSDDQRWKVIRYVQDTFARPVMRDPAEGDPTGPYAGLTNPVPLTVDATNDGKTIFIRECMYCHGDAGRGSGPYREGIQPGPPDFGDGSYGDKTDADYYWRISEGLPWSAMPVWKLQYSEEDRWKLVHYVMTEFTQTEAKPVVNELQVRLPDVYLEQTMPESASFERGKELFLTTCAHCHGLAGDGTGWDGAYLNPTPADLRTLAGVIMQPNAEGLHLITVTFGIKNTAMPVWGEFLPVEQRWDALKFVIESFEVGRPANASVLGSGNIAANFITLSQDNWLGEAHVISATHGADLYGTYCTTCHGDGGLGQGPGTVGNASGSPAPFPKNMELSYVLWRLWDGVPQTVMYPFSWLLSEDDLWDIATYAQSLTSTTSGGG